MILKRSFRNSTIKNNSTFYKLLKLYLWILLITIVSWLVIRKISPVGFPFGWTTVAQIRNQEFTVKARFNSGSAISAEILCVLVVKPWYNLVGNAELLRLYNYARQTKLTLGDNSILFVNTYNSNDNFVKFYFLFNLSTDQGNTLILGLDEKLLFSEPISVDSNASCKVVVKNVTNIPNAINIGLTSIPYYLNERDLLILGADSVQVSFADPRVVKLDIKWNNGQRTKDYCLHLPKYPREFMDVCDQQTSLSSP